MISSWGYQLTPQNYQLSTIKNSVTDGDHMFIMHVPNMVNNNSWCLVCHPCIINQKCIQVQIQILQIKIWNTKYKFLKKPAKYKILTVVFDSKPDIM